MTAEELITYKEHQHKIIISAFYILAVGNGLAIFDIGRSSDNALFIGSLIWLVASYFFWGISEHILYRSNALFVHVKIPMRLSDIGNAKIKEKDADIKELESIAASGDNDHELNLKNHRDDLQELKGVVTKLRQLAQLKMDKITRSIFNAICGIIVCVGFSLILIIAGFLNTYFYPAKITYDKGFLNNYFHFTENYLPNIDQESGKYIIYGSLQIAVYAGIIWIILFKWRQKLLQKKIDNLRQEIITSKTPFWDDSL